MLVPAVSVIMNVRNGARYLREALDSVIAQTFTDWELIFWDDGSTDASADIVATYHDDRIRYILSPEEPGLGRARHCATREARGEWLAFLDQDDVWLPTKLEKQMCIARQDPEAGIVYGRALAFDRRGRERDYDHRHEFQPLPENDIFEVLFQDTYLVCMSAVMFRRALCEAIGGVPPEIKTIPDYYLLVKLAQRSRARAVQEVVCRYRLHESNMSRTRGRLINEEALWVIDESAQLLDPELAEWRRRVHHTCLAVHEMQRLQTVATGFLRLITRGSLTFLLSRPFAITFRSMRRRIRQPCWRKNAPPDEQSRPLRPLPRASRPLDHQSDLKSGEVDVSVIIVTYNIQHLIENCLKSLFEECAGLNAEVFVVDSASNDKTVEVVRSRFPNVWLHASDVNIGFSAGNNIALPHCRGRYVALLNPDTVVHKGALRRLMSHLEEHPGAGAAGPALRLGNGEIQVECARNLPSIGNLFPWLLLLDKAECALRYRNRTKDTGRHPARKTLLDGYTLLTWPRNRTCEVESICGACMVIRREVVERIGMLDEAAPLYLDDIDYCRRIHEAGWSIHYVADATITHFWKQSSSDFTRAGDFYAMGIHSIWLYLRKHEGWPSSTMFLMMACVASPIRVCISAVATALCSGERKMFWKRQLNMALGLTRWALRFPKSPPRFGFANEKPK